MAAAAKPAAHTAIQDVSTLAISYMAGMARREAVVAAVSASLSCLQQKCGRDSVEMAVGLNLMTVACMQMEELPPDQLVGCTFGFTGRRCPSSLHVHLPSPCEKSAKQVRPYKGAGLVH